MEPLLAGEAWVVDSPYMGKLGLLVLDAADTVVWLLGALWGRESLVQFALRNHRRGRRGYPVRLAGHSVVRLRSRREMRRWLTGVQL